MTTPLTQLGSISTDDFIREYWQQKPLLIRQAIPDYQSPVTPDELAGLALEEDVESRIILEKGKSPWELRRGPFNESEFSKLPADKWTLLIQAADHLIPEVADLLDQFRFIPSWRLDDIMISYATRGGSVGPHYDQYDVFLLQAGGKRHWQIGQHCNAGSRKRDDTDLHILTEFHEQESFTLEPGDMLYLPPQVAHWGKALDDDCITYSIGFRAPSQAEILEELLQEHLSTLTEDHRFQDPAFTPQQHSGEISHDALQQIHQLWSKAITPASIENWFGRYMTTPKYEIEDRLTCEEVASGEVIPEELPCWAPEDLLTRDPASRFAFLTDDNSNRSPEALPHGQCHLFVDGNSYSVNEKLAHLLSNKRTFTGTALSDAIQDDQEKLIVQTLLLNQQLFILDEEDAEED
ncbi:cupin domain-containing protein [Aestuariicella sp. G3-2]|uniref:cupin domain-containing protein n=1 Tax=Pseudomaricurvus albidus TaxID=2842452 RepID=UPI001C0CC61A|nr:cupin domain-containing protein [Aestuariicella albida]MBU3070489.1 cupin domain-containing protein [Aestuariicella albida]